MEDLVVYLEDKGYVVPAEKKEELTHLLDQARSLWAGAGERHMDAIQALVLQQEREGLGYDPSAVPPATEGAIYTERGGKVYVIAEGDHPGLWDFSGDAAVADELLQQAEGVVAQ